MISEPTVTGYDMYVDMSFTDFIEMYRKGSSFVRELAFRCGASRLNEIQTPTGYRVFFSVKKLDDADIFRNQLINLLD